MNENICTLNNELGDTPASIQELLTEAAKSYRSWKYLWINPVNSGEKITDFSGFWNKEYLYDEIGGNSLKQFSIKEAKIFGENNLLHLLNNRNKTLISYWFVDNNNIDFSIDSLKALPLEITGSKVFEKTIMTHRNVVLRTNNNRKELRTGLAKANGNNDMVQAKSYFQNGKLKCWLLSEISEVN